MKRWDFLVVGLSLLAAGVFAASVHAHGEQAHDGAHAGGVKETLACAPGETSAPILTVADFDGSGVVDGADLKELAARIVRRDQAAFFDVNGDFMVSDADLARAAAQVGARSTAMDRELAALFRATERYRDLGEAIADGYVPLTQPLAGHGVHWGHPELGLVFEPLRPPGLLYSQGGRLLGAYFSVDITRETPDVVPTGFSGDELWHSHEALCLRGVNWERPTYDPSALNLDLCVPEAECTGGPWLNKVYMVHVWLFEPNPCGVFGLTDPRITEGAPERTVAERCPGGEAHLHPVGPRPAAGGHTRH
jgi:hypothetical protein